MNVLPPTPPTPSKDPFILGLQKKSWAVEPFSRQRLYLKAMSQRLGVGMLNPKYFVHWTADSYKYDVLDQKPWEEAKANGKIILDSDMCDSGSETVVFIYAKPEDRKWVEDNVGISDLIECPEELVQAIEKIKATPFPSLPSQ
uniref:Uncharacterized protein n=1 Tax=Alexandrium catenella TaxID=2925 RepID=A0A7S1W0W4_ALECA